MLKVSHSVKKTLFIVFVVLAIVNLGAYFFIYSALDNNDTEISVAARNEVLSQKIAYYANLYVGGNVNARNLAKQAIELFDQSLMTLRDGGVAPGLDEKKEIEKISGRPLEVLRGIEELWEAYKSNAEIIINVSPESITTSDVQTSLNYINNNTNLLQERTNDFTNSLLSNSETKELKTKMFLIGGLLLLFISFLAALFYLRLSLIKPLDYFKVKLEALSKGDYEQEVRFQGKEEYNQFAHYLGQVFNKFRLMASFIEFIGQGKLDYEVDKSKKEIVKDDKIFIALEKTKSELIKVEKENEVRQWTNEGIRIVSELLQRRYDQVQDLYDKLIATIVKYVEGNQGGMFLVTGENEDMQLELSACYAYERKKFLHEKFDVEEGLLGQAFKEKSIIYLTEVPDNYVRITSGLGRSTPDSLILVPLKDNEAVVGVIELASFGKIEQYRIEFLEKISELIASALNTIIVNEKTKYLLSESQQQAEEMRAQEEEMRQNMEELQATQEEMARKEREITKLLEDSAEKERETKELLKEIQGKEKFLDTLINVSNDSIVAVNRDYQVVIFNKKMQESYGVSGVTLRKDLDILSTFPEGEMRENFQTMFDSALKGEFVEKTIENSGKNGPKYHLVNCAPIKDEKDSVVAAVLYSKDITELVKTQKEAEQLLNEAQIQTEQMIAQEEELKQNLEEMAAIQDELEKRAAEAESAKSKLELESAMFTGLMDVLSDRITIKDKRGVYLRINKTKEESLKSLGITEYLGVTDAEIFDEDHYKKSLEIEKKIVDSGDGILNEQSKTVMKNGTVLWGETSRVPFKNSSGVILGTLVVTRDITKEKNYEEKLQIVEKELEILKKK